MKHARNLILRLFSLLCLICFISGCSSPDKGSSPTTTVPKEPISQIGKETLQYPASNSEYEFNVYETYVEIEEYLGESANVVVPQRLENLPVKVVSGFCFNNSIKNVTLPESIVVIGDRAFEHCEALETINIPKNAKVIGEHAFFDCTSLKSLTIPKNVTTIGEKAFGMGLAEYGGYVLIDTLVVRFYKGSAAAQYVADCPFEINFEIIEE